MIGSVGRTRVGVGRRDRRRASAGAWRSGPAGVGVGSRRRFRGRRRLRVADALGLTVSRDRHREERLARPVERSIGEVIDAAEAGSGSYLILPSLSRSQDAVRRVGHEDGGQPVAVEVDVVGEDTGRIDVQAVVVGVVYASLVPTGGRFRTPEEAWSARGRAREEHRRECQPCEPGTQADRRPWRCKVTCPSDWTMMSSLEAPRDHSVGQWSCRRPGRDGPVPGRTAPPADAVRWRRGWDSNPRSLSTQRFSRAPPSTARPPLRPSGYQRGRAPGAVRPTASGGVDGRRHARRRPCRR